MEYVTLRKGVIMPKLGFGVFQVSGDETTRCVSDAIEVGYRHIDTAQSYMNESEVGQGIRDSGIMPLPYDKRRLQLYDKG